MSEKGVIQRLTKAMHRYTRAHGKDWALLATIRSGEKAYFRLVSDPDGAPLIMPPSGAREVMVFGRAFPVERDPLLPNDRIGVYLYGDQAPIISITVSDG